MREDRVYIAIFTRHGRGWPLRVLWETTEEVARAVCSDDRTAGRNWFLGWTRVAGQRVKWEKDDGRFAPLLYELGLRAEGHRLVKQRAGGA